MVGQEKEWVGYFLNDLRAFGIDADQWTAAAQTRGNGAEQQNKGRNISWRNGCCRESQSWTTACSRMTERDGKDQEENSPKQAGSYWIDCPC